MNRQRKLLVATLFLMPLVVVGAACSFPDVTFAPDGTEAGATPEGSTPTSEGSTSNPDTGGKPSGNEGGTDAGPADADAEAAADGATVFDGAIPDADETDAGVVDPTGCAAKPTCDCDEDGYKAADCGVGPSQVDASLNAKPGDCDDFDGNRHPGAPARDEVTDNGDWNCDGVVTKTPPSNMTSCAKSGTACEPNFGFFNDPGCGVPANEYQCVAKDLVLGACAGPQPTALNPKQQCQ